MNNKTEHDSYNTTTIVEPPIVLNTPKIKYGPFHAGEVSRALGKKATGKPLTAQERFMIGQSGAKRGADGSLHESGSGQRLTRREISSYAGTTGTPRTQASRAPRQQTTRDILGRQTNNSSRSSNNSNQRSRSNTRTRQRTNNSRRTSGRRTYTPRRSYTQRTSYYSPRRSYQRRTSYAPGSSRNRRYGR